MMHVYLYRVRDWHTGELKWMYDCMPLIRPYSAVALTVSTLTREEEGTPQPW